MTQKRIVGGCFKLISTLGSGGFGETFLAADVCSGSGEKFVVKQLNPRTDDAEVIKLSKRLFEQEVKILYRIGEHRQIPSIITHFEEENELYFVQEYVEGKTFAELLAKGKIFSQREVVAIVTELLSVLAFVHNCGAIHRDVKPANLICRASDGETVLIDFGAVKQFGEQNAQQLRHSTIAIGSEGYMPAEQLGGHPRFSSDVYAVGMFAVHLLTQTHPANLRQNQRTGEWIWQDKVSVNVQFAEFINKMIRYDFRQRFADASEALNHLKKLNLAKPENAVWNPNKIYRNERDERQTQATFFSPAAIERESQPVDSALNSPRPYKEQNFPPPLHSQANVPPNNSAPTQIVYPLVHDQTRMSETDNVTLGGLAFDGFMAWNILKPLLILFVLFGLIFVIGAWALSMSRQNAYQPPQFLNNPSPPLITKTPPKIETPISAAQEKTLTAKTNEDWYRAALEWKKAEEYYAKVESLADNPIERENAAKDKDFCTERKNTALSMSQRSLEKRY